MRTYPSLVAGKRLDGHDFHPVFSPWDGRQVGQVHLATPAHVEAALEAGHHARPAMAALPAWKRRQILDSVAGQLRARTDEFAALISAEAGKPLHLARGEVLRAIDTFSFSADEAGRLQGDLLDLGAAQPGEGRWGIVRRFPVGLVSAITPFNFPLNLVAHKLAPAIAAGCPVVLKPAPQAPLSAFALAELCIEAGLPPGGLNVVFCHPGDAEPLVTDKRVHLLTFTGSAAVGWQLHALAGKKKVLLELGGNAVAIVHEDADLALAVARVAQGGFAYAGQSCISVQRVLVHRARVEAFCDRLVQAAREVPCGDPADARVVCGPLIDDKAATRLDAWLAEAVAEGARVLLGGPRQGRLMPPKVLRDVPHHCKLWYEEAFGPVVCVQAYTDLDEALQVAGDTRYGLQAGVFTKSLPVLWKCFEGLEVGGVIHDDVPTFRVDPMPYGGVRDSGLGREGPREVIREYTEPRLLAMRPNG